MDNLVLVRLVIELDDILDEAVLEEIRQESAERFRLVFASTSGNFPLVASLTPELPWIGQPAFRWGGPSWSPDPFTNAAARALLGRRVVGVSKPPCDRSIRIDLGDGRGLVLELATHGANLILLSAGGTVDAALKRPKRGAERLEPGGPWASRALPVGKLDPFEAGAGEIDALVERLGRVGQSPFDVLRRDVLGVGAVGAALVVEEARQSRLSPGTLLRDRLDALLSGNTEVVIEGPEDPRRASDQGAFSPETFRLLPWRTSAPATEKVLFSSDSSLATAGLFHESLERVERVRGRIAALGTILRAELRRTCDAEQKVREELSSFLDPQQYVRMGEALLAGLTVARRAGDTVLVPDPYDADSVQLAVPAPASKSLTRVASDLFQRGRRSRRGAEIAAARAQTLADRAGRLEKLLVAHERASGSDGVEALEVAMRGEKLAVGLARPTRAARAAALTVPPRLEGVRILTSSDGWTILVGRTGRDNDRLTFKIASPEDLWLHASGSPGAHVIIRNPERRSTVPEPTLLEAARAAAWFSDLRSDGTVEVQWTRRKHVRRARGGSPGRVLLKRFETVRVRPAPPKDIA